MIATDAHDPAAWDAFLSKQRFRPFLQSWAMGDVYRDIGQPPVRLAIEDRGALRGICFGHIVNAKRGRHLSIPYGPVIREDPSSTDGRELLTKLMEELRRIARAEKCSFIRLSPFWPQPATRYPLPATVPSPLHLLAEHVWYLPLTTVDQWTCGEQAAGGQQRTRSEEELLMQMRKTTRNLIRRAERDGVEIVASSDPVSDVETFIMLHSETRRRHGFTPYTDAFFRAQVRRMSAEHRCTVYLARHGGSTIAASIHMHAFGETSYHHGASLLSKIPCSYLLQWRAIQDALKRGDHVYNFWGIAPISEQRAVAGDEPRQRRASSEQQATRADSPKLASKSHPFAGVTLFKTGFGAPELPLIHCQDVPLGPLYWLTYGFEMLRRWRRGF